MEDYLKILEKNKTSLINDNIHKLMIYAFVSKYKCSQSRSNFLISQQKYEEKENIGKYSKEYIDCYYKVINQSNSKCSTHLNNALKCIKTKDIKTNNEIIDIECVNPLEELLHCNNVSL